MKLEVPFYPQTTELNCGPAALRMVLAFLGKDPGLEILEEKTGIKEGKGISTVQIAIVAAALGYKANILSKHIFFSEELLKLEFYKKYGDNSLEISKRRVKEAKAAGVDIEEKTTPLKDLLSLTTEKSIPIVLVDWNIINGNRHRGYQGHFVPVVGYDEEFIYIHNPGPDTAQAFMPVKREVFDEARKAEGTDEDILFISNI